MLTEEERQVVYAMAGRLLGTVPGRLQDSVLASVESRMRTLGLSRLLDYLVLVEKDEAELARLVSALKGTEKAPPRLLAVDHARASREALVALCSGANGWHVT